MQATLIFLLGLLPWLNPFTNGPSTWVGPWLVSFACGVIVFGIERPEGPNRGVTLFLGILSAWTLVRSGWAPETVALVAGCLLVWMSAAMTSRPDDAVKWGRRVALVWLAAAAISTLAALLQYFGLSSALSPWVNTTDAGEAFANLRQRNQFASLTVLGAAVIIFWWPAGRRWVWAAGAVAWLAVGNAVTTSRTGLLQLILIGLLGCIWPGPRKWRAKLWAAGMLGYIVAAVALPWALQASTGIDASHLWSRVASSQECGSRVVLWSNVAHLIAQKPWLGWGWGELDFAHFTTLYPGPRFCDILDNAHNLPLHLAVELGVPAAALFCAGLCWAMFRTKPWRESDPVRQLAWAALLVIAVHSLLEYPLWYGPFQIAVGLSLGLLGMRRPAVGAPDHPSVAPPVDGTRLALAILALAGSAYAAWDYHRVSQIYLPVASRSPEWRDDPLSRIRDSWLFRNQARFAELTITPLARDNAVWMHDTAADLLHFSPEPRVVEKLIESSVMLGRSDEALLQLARFRAAFPKDYAQWRQGSQPAP
jgi:O-antigen ligase